jgi:hypothetical protein
MMAIFMVFHPGFETTADVHSMGTDVPNGKGKVPLIPQRHVPHPRQPPVLYFNSCGSSGLLPATKMIEMLPASPRIVFQGKEAAMSLADKDSIRDLADRAIRESLRHPEHLRGLLEQAVPDLAANFDYQKARLLDREFPIEDWRRREADLPFEIPYRLGTSSTPTLVVLLLEHQSDTDPMMPLRLLYFAVVYWDQQWREWEKLTGSKPAFQLRPVLPLVAYTGTTPWGSNRTLTDLLGEPQAFHAFAPSWQPLFWDLAAKSPEELLTSDNNWVQMMAVLRAEDTDAATFKDIFTQAVNQVKKIKGVEEVRWYDLMRILLTWVYWRRPEAERPALLAEAENAQASVKRRTEVHHMANKLGPSFVDLAVEKGQKMGEKIGKEIGEKIGELKNSRDILKTLLSDRFGRVPKKLQKEIDALEDVSRLHKAIRQVHKCASLSEFQL